MGFSGLFGVAVGLILVYTVLGLLCTTINELIATIFKLRARLLSKALTTLIDNADLRKAFYNNGLIASAKVASRGGEPPPAVTDATTAPASQDAGASDVKKTAEATSKGVPKDKDHPSYIDSRTFAMALLGSLSVCTQQNATEQKAFPDMAQIRDLATRLPNGKIRDVLLASLATTSNDLSKLRDDLAGWFDTAMGRLSGEYKRTTKKIALIVGCLLATTLNADSIAIGRALWRDETLRDQLVSVAAETIKSTARERLTPNGTAAISSSPDHGPPITGPGQISEASTATGQACTNPDPIGNIACLLGKMKKEEQELRPFPIGWKASELPDENWPSFICLKFLGLAWTGLALSLGAPFWFDLLQKIMNVRGTGVKPQEKKFEPTS